MAQRKKASTRPKTSPPKKKTSAPALATITLPPELDDDVTCVAAMVKQIDHFLRKDRDEGAASIAREIISALKHREWRRVRYRAAMSEQREAAQAREMAHRHARRRDFGPVVQSLMRSAEYHDENARKMLAEAT